MALFSLVFSLSVIVTVVARVAVSALPVKAPIKPVAVILPVEGL